MSIQYLQRLSSMNPMIYTLKAGVRRCTHATLALQKYRIAQDRLAGPASGQIRVNGTYFLVKYAKIYLFTRSDSHNWKFHKSSGYCGYKESTRKICIYALKKLHCETSYFNSYLVHVFIYYHL